MNDECPLCGGAAERWRDSVDGQPVVWFNCGTCKSLRFDEYGLRWLQGATDDTRLELSQNGSRAEEGWFLAIERDPRRVQSDGKNGIEAIQMRMHVIHRDDLHHGNAGEMS